MLALWQTCCRRQNIDCNFSTEINIVEAWRKEYNEDRLKKSLGGQTPAAYP